MRKFLPDLSNSSNYSVQDHNFIIFRYAETLLNYAESVNEMANVAANRTIAYAQLTALRKRAGITAGANALYGLKANKNQAEMRDAIKLERRIELAFEEHRFWDVRRWKTAEVDFNKILKGVSITKSGTGILSYKTVNVAPIRFIAPKMYLYPIPFTELVKNKTLTQNPGWLQVFIFNKAKISYEKYIPHFFTGVINGRARVGSITGTGYYRCY